MSEEAIKTLQDQGLGHPTLNSSNLSGALPWRLWDIYFQFVFVGLFLFFTTLYSHDGQAPSEG